MADLVLGGRRIPAGSRALIRLPVARDLTGHVEIVCHAIAGRDDGPTLLLLSMLHGNEWFSALVVREVLARTNPAVLKGSVIGVPVANAPAFLTDSRCILDDADEPDANRTFGGPYQWLSNQLTRVIADELFSVSSALIDYHVGGWGATMADVSYVTDYSNPALAARSRELAVAYAFPVVHALQIFGGLRGPRTSLGHAGERFGIPGIVAEVGGLGWGDRQEAAWLDQNVAGTLGVMREMQMLDGPRERCERYLHFSEYWRVGPKAGGYLEPLVGLDRQFKEVAKDEMLARVTDPLTFETVDEIRSPGRGIVFYACRPHMVRPGGWAFGVANSEDTRTEWIAS